MLTVDTCAFTKTKIKFKHWSPKSSKFQNRKRTVIIRRQAQKRNKEDQRSHLIAAFKNEMQHSTRVLAAPRASASCCISSSSARRCGRAIRGNNSQIFLTRSKIDISYHNHKSKETKRIIFTEAVSMETCNMSSTEYKEMLPIEMQATCHYQHITERRTLANTFKC